MKDRMDAEDGREGEGDIDGADCGDHEGSDVPTSQLVLITAKIVGSQHHLGAFTHGDATPLITSSPPPVTSPVATILHQYTSS
jgi:hypothetical protein